jgi:hypothetical protein
MSLGFLRSPQWILGRRIALVAIILILGIRNYGGALTSWFAGPDPAGDVTITQVEFRPDIDTVKPVWIIGLRNQSERATYDQIELEAIYRDKDGKVLETDKLLVRQKLAPGEEQLIASTDIKTRPGATSGSLKVLGASREQP